VTEQAAADVASDALAESLEWLALNEADEGHFQRVALALIPHFPQAWREYAQAVQDLWELATGADPYLYSDADPKLFAAAEVRAFETDQRVERRDAALATLLGLRDDRNGDQA
jgi:hypothetical protein